MLIWVCLIFIQSATSFMHCSSGLVGRRHPQLTYQVESLHYHMASLDALKRCTRKVVVGSMSVTTTTAGILLSATGT